MVKLMGTAQPVMTFLLILNLTLKQKLYLTTNDLKKNNINLDQA